jgi:hypothetical protein
MATHAAGVGPRIRSETTHVLADWAFHHDVGEIFAVVRPGNLRAAATVHRNSMEWVGETKKYFGMTLQVFRLRRADFRRNGADHAPATERGLTGLGGEGSPHPTRSSWAKCAGETASVLASHELNEAVLLVLDLLTLPARPRTKACHDRQPPSSPALPTPRPHGSSTEPAE